MNKELNLSINVMHKLIVSTDLFGKVNTLLARMKNPYLLTYLLEPIEALSSNKIESIFTTVDQAYNDLIQSNDSTSEFVKYRETLKQAHIRLNNNEIIRSNDIEWINKSLLGNNVGYRKIPVTIKDSNGKVIHKPVDASKISEEISSLVKLINEDRDMNQIIKSFIIHHKFEWIHPFADGNGRTGRILLALLFKKYEILDIPASIISLSISQDKTKYYEGLNAADNGDINKYLENMLDLLNDSLNKSIVFINEYNKKLNDVLEQHKDNEPFSKVIEWCFAGVKVSNSYLVKKTSLNNKTVKKYIDILENEGVIKIERVSNTTPYKNLFVERLITKYFVIE